MRRRFGCQQGRTPRLQRLRLTSVSPRHSVAPSNRTGFLMHPKRWFSLAAMVVASAAAALTGCGGSDAKRAAADAKASPAPPAANASATATARRWTSGYPNSIAVLGHSGSTGENSDPDQPGVEVRENSWATGSNPEVNSL